MAKTVQKLVKLLTLFSFGGMLYGLIELAWRGYTHISMFVVGGICFVLIGALDEMSPEPPPVAVQLPMAALIVTAVELASGVVINLVMRLDVWNYSDLPFNIMGQICLYFAFLWLLLAFPAIIIEDSLRVMLFNEKPKTLRFLPRKRIKKKEALS